MKKAKKIFVSLLSMLMVFSMISSTFVKASNNRLSINAIQPIEGLREDFIRGVDISSLEKVEFYGGKFFDNGQERDVLEILKDRGVNWVRLRLWNDPVLDGGFCDKESVIAMAKRTKAQGFKLLLNFHYSDHWADPGQQTKPAAWADLSFEELTQAVYDYTYEVVSELKEEDALPDMVQIGNEIRSGMLWPDGKSWGEDGYEFDRLAELLKSGIKAVHDAAGDESVKIALHLDNGHDNGTYIWWFDEITQRDVEFDVIGLSWYPYWHGNLEQLKNNMNDISERYGKEVAVFETAYGFTLEDADGHSNIFGIEQQEVAGYPASVQGQADLLYDVFKAVADVPNNQGLGVFYWEPAWLGVEGAGWIEGEGNAWENQAMFDFDGNALDSLYIFGGIVEPLMVGYDAIDVQTDVGVAPNLPDTINAWYTDGVERQVKVIWDTIEPEKYNEEGVFSVVGEIEGMAKTVVANVTVNPVEDTIDVQEVILTIDKDILKTNEKAQLELKAKMSDGNYIDISCEKAVFESSNINIATVDKNGIVTAIDVGNTEIRAIVTIDDSTYNTNSIFLTVKESVTDKPIEIEPNIPDEQLELNDSDASVDSNDSLEESVESNELVVDTMDESPKENNKSIDILPKTGKDTKFVFYLGSALIIIVSIFIWKKF